MTLFDYYAPRVKAYLKRLGATDSLAEDLSQEVMLTVWRKAASYDPAKAGVGTWIFTIARNLRIDALRRERRPELDPTDPRLAPEPAAPARPPGRGQPRGGTRSVPRSARCRRTRRKWLRWPSTTASRTERSRPSWRCRWGRSSRACGWRFGGCAGMLGEATMTPRHHPSDATLLTYAAGALGEGLSLVVASHLAYCAECRDAVAERRGHRRQPARSAGAGRRSPARARERVLALSTAPPAAPPRAAQRALPPSCRRRSARYLGRNLAAVPWRRLGPGLHQFEVLPHDHARVPSCGCCASRPGASCRATAIPGPSSRSCFPAPIPTSSDTSAAATSRRPMSDDRASSRSRDRGEDCVCLIATEGPLQFESMIARVFPALRRHLKSAAPR